MNGVQQSLLTHHRRTSRCASIHHDVCDFVVAMHFGMEIYLKQYQSLIGAVVAVVGNYMVYPCVD